jgi:hypothetical protein
MEYGIYAYIEYGIYALHSVDGTSAGGRWEVLQPRGCFWLQRQQSNDTCGIHVADCVAIALE